MLTTSISDISIFDLLAFFAVCWPQKLLPGSRGNYSFSHTVMHETVKLYGSSKSSIKSSLETNPDSE